jgi:pyruvate/2-oxoglutarate dehydrogenase complex dihydrolipoamide dehydrogenase (E3) component
MSEERHELVVVGAGTAGFAAASAARAAGRDVVLVTGSDELGGTCILRGCMPAKSLLAATHAEGEVDRARELGVATGGSHIDLRAVIGRKRALVDYFAEDRLEALDELPTVRGDARFVGPATIASSSRREHASRRRRSPDSTACASSRAPTSSSSKSGRRRSRSSAAVRSVARSRSTSRA